MGPDAIEVEGAELVPFGENDDGVGSLHCFVGTGLEFHAREQPPRLEGLGVERLDASAHRAQCGNDLEGGRGAHIVGVGLEGQAKDADRPARHLAAERRNDPPRQRALAHVVDLRGGLDEPQAGPGVDARADQGGGVLGKAGSAVAGASMQEFRPDPLVEPDPLGNLLDIGADLFAEVGDFVDEGDLHRQEGVGGVFDQFRGPPVGDHHRRLDEIERAIDLHHRRAGPLVVQPDHDPVGPLEILYRRALAQELGIGHYREIGIGTGLADDGLDLIPRPDRDGRLGDDDGEAFDQSGDLAGRVTDVGEIGIAVAAARGSADGDEHRLGARHSLRRIGGEAEARTGDIALDDGLQARLIDRHYPGLEAFDSHFFGVDAGHVVAEVG